MIIRAHNLTSIRDYRPSLFQST